MNNLKALVIDDSGVMRKMVMKGLTEAKLAEFEFIEAEDGNDGLVKLQANEIDIAFVDWNMPNMTGVEFVAEVRKLERKNCTDRIPMIMVTSEKTMSKMQTALDEAGADHFISKPFTAEELKVKLKKHVDKALLVRMRKNREARESSAAPAQPQATGGWFSKMLG